jgi:hypothetical protein
MLLSSLTRMRERLTFPDKAKLLLKDEVVTPVMTKRQTVCLQRRPVQTGLLHTGYSSYRISDTTTDATTWRMYGADCEFIWSDR